MDPSCTPARIAAFRFGSDSDDASFAATPWQPPFSDTIAAQAKYLHDLVRAWKSKLRGQLMRLTSEGNTVVADLFDPNRTSALVSFVAVGGIDVLSALLQDRSVDPTDMYYCDSYNLFTRILTEIVIVNNAFSWYFFDA